MFDQSRTTNINVDLRDIVQLSHLYRNPNPWYQILQVSTAPVILRRVLPAVVAAPTPTVEQFGGTTITEKPSPAATENGPVTELLLNRLIGASDAFHNLRRRNKEACASKPSVKRFPDRLSLATQEAVIR